MNPILLAAVITIGASNAPLDCDQAAQKLSQMPSIIKHSNATISHVKMMEQKIMK